MRKELTAVIEREGDGYVALCPEVDVASVGDTVAQARENLCEALELFFETACMEVRIRRRGERQHFLTRQRPRKLPRLRAPEEEIAGRLRSEVYVTRVEVAVGQSRVQPSIQSFARDCTRQTPSPS